MIWILVSAAGSHGSPITKHPKLESDVTPPPPGPPSLPPKTRKLLAGAGETARPGSQESTGREPAAQTTSTNTTKRQHHQLHKPATSGHQPQPATLESSQASVSVVRIGPGVTRSVSSAGSRPVRTRVVKPLRRSKSHLTSGPGRCVTNITHGGSVTLVSLNNQDEELRTGPSREFQPIEPDRLSPR